MPSTAGRIFFKKNGRARSWQRRFLLSRSGDVRPSFKRLVFKKNGKLRAEYSHWFGGETGQIAGGETGQISGANRRPISVRQYLDDLRPAHNPLRTFTDRSNPRRISVVTDSVGVSSLFGGVGTAVILAALWARRSGSILRIITRTEPPVTTSVNTVLAANGLSGLGNVEFAFAPHDGGPALALGDKDLFLATSWWTSRCLLNTVPAERITYILQEDERMFYSYCDEHLMCALTLAAPFRRVIVNSSHLHSHLTQGPEAVSGLASRAIFFDPAFVHRPRSFEAASAGSKKRDLFFYARPKHSRNLFQHGIQLLDEAARTGILDPLEWRLNLVGADVPRLKFSNGLEVRHFETMSWADYSEFIRNMDAGVSLMYTPHSSYPPLDLASVGVPVLTNRHGVKQDLQFLSKNIITRDLPLSDLLGGLEELLSLARDVEACRHNTEEDNIPRSWEASLSDTVETLCTISGVDQ